MMAQAAISTSQGHIAGRLALARDAALSLYTIYVVCGGLSVILGLGPDLALNPEAASSSLTNQIVLLSLLAVAIYIATAGGMKPSEVLGGIAPFLPVLIVIAASPLWSSAPDASVRRTLRFLIEFSALATLANTYQEPRRAMQVLWRTFALIALLDMALIAVPSVSYSDIGYQGAHGHKNTAGSFALLALPLALGAVFDRNIARQPILAVLVLAAILAIMALSLSKTSAALTIVVLTMAALVLALARVEAAALTALAMMVAGIFLAVLFAASVSGMQLADYLRAAGIDPTLTGRDEIWRFTLRRASERPWLGVGYGGFWGTWQSSEAALRDFGITFIFGQAHNGYIDVLVQIGWIGMSCVGLLAIGGLAALFWKARITRDRTLVFMALTVFWALWLHNITESTLLRTGTDIWMLFVLMLPLAARSATREAVDVPTARV